MFPSLFGDHVPTLVNDFVAVIGLLHLAAFTYVAVSFTLAHLKDETRVQPDRPKWQ